MKKTLRETILPKQIEGGHCNGIDTDLFMEYEFHHDVKRVCATCPFALPCFATAVNNNYEGTWGGVWFGVNIKRDRALGPSQTQLAGKPSRKMIEGYAHMLMRVMGLSTEEYTRMFGYPNGVKAFRRALESIKQAEAA